MLKISFEKITSSPQGVALLFVGAGGKLGPTGTALDRKMGGTIRKAIKASPLFKGEKGETLNLLAPAKSRLSRLVLVGTGNPSDATSFVFEEIGGAAASALKGENKALFIVDELPRQGMTGAEAAAHAAFGARLKLYAFDKYRTKKTAKDKPLHALAVACADPAKARAAFAPLAAVSDGMLWARDLVSEPANKLDPETMMKAALSLKELGVEVEVLDRQKMEALRMGCLLGVAQGSEKPPYLVAMRWNGGKKNEPPVAFVGKGVTFDSGGISLKPGAGMGEMKTDMGGAAAVMGAMKILALRKAKANVVGVVGLVENMPSGRAMRPGDVIESASGQTVEVLNTDAEGRLVLADAIWFAQEKGKARLLIDLATLTGAIGVALGHEYAGLFANDEKLAAQIEAAAKKTNEPVWRMPLNKAYDKKLDSPVADMKNIGGREGGSCTAACFLQRFVRKGAVWAHLDIAGMAWQDEARTLSPKGATGFGARLLDRFVADVFET